MSDSAVTASQLGLCLCHGCGGLSRLGGDGHDLCCRRCGAALHLRKPDSIARTWAYLIAAYILYVPANTLPMMRTGSLFGAQADTIMSGVVYLWHSGSWHIALVVFIASVVVPLPRCSPSPTCSSRCSWAGRIGRWSVRDSIGYLSSSVPGRCWMCLWS